IAAIAIAIGLAGGALVGSRAPTSHLQVGTGLRPTAEAWIDVGAGWDACSFSAARARLLCPGGVDIYDVTTTLLGDEQPGWPFTTPAIRVDAPHPVQVRLGFDVRLTGRYWIAASGAAFTVDLGDGSPGSLAAQRVLEVAGERDHLTLTGAVAGTATLTWVREDALAPAPVGPPPPPAP
ncbi:MAG: hypothetical protein R2939_00030, partial [Kofleriaceae bacterium]